MKEFMPDQFIFMGGIHTVRKVGAEISKDTYYYNQEQIKACLEDAESSRTLCKNLGLSLSLLSIERIIAFLSQKTKISANNTIKLFDELDNRILDEMKSMKFLSIDSKKVYLLDAKNQFGIEVTEAFPSAKIDIEEAAKCLAFERWTAAVFHLMRVMEVGLKYLAKSLNLTATTNMNWDSILKKCEAELSRPLAQRSPEWVEDNAFFSSATAMLRSVKDAWRNPTMHIERVYTEEQAQDIWNGVKGFMRQLATHLKENHQ